jgi:hypothetical protein
VHRQFLLATYDCGAVSVSSLFASAVSETHLPNALRPNPFVPSRPVRAVLLVERLAGPCGGPALRPALLRGVRVSVLLLDGLFHGLLAHARPEVAELREERLLGGFHGAAQGLALRCRSALVGLIRMRLGQGAHRQSEATASPIDTVIFFMGPETRVEREG